MNIKKEFHIDTLLDIYAFIDGAYDSCEKETFATRLQIKSYSCDLIYNYADLLRTTKLTKSMFVGDDAIFEGFEKKASAGETIQYTYHTDRFCVIFFKPFMPYDTLQAVVKIEAYTIKENLWEVDRSEFIETLSDLANLTKDNPIKLK